MIKCPYLAHPEAESSGPGTLLSAPPFPGTPEASGKTQVAGRYLQGAVDGEETGGGRRGSRLGGGVLQHQQLAVCLLSKQQLGRQAEVKSGGSASSQMLGRLSPVQPCLRWRNKGLFTREQEGAPYGPVSQQEPGLRVKSPGSLRRRRGPGLLGLRKEAGV
jgi:hypothetical protein